MSRLRRHVMQALTALLHCVPAGGASAFFAATPPAKGRDQRGRTWEAAMDELTLGELKHLTREQLCELWTCIALSLSSFEPGTVARTNALTSLANIGRVMRLRHLI